MSYRFTARTLPHLTLTPAHDPVIDQLPVQDWSFEDQEERMRATLNFSIPTSETDLLNQLLKVDPDNHDNDIGSIIHAYAEGNVDAGGDPAPVLSFFLGRRGDQLAGRTTSESSFQAGHLLTIFDHAIVYPFDWNRYPTIEGDWQYGADSILDNGDFDSTAILNEIQTIVINEDIDGGTWVAAFKQDITGPLAWDITQGDLQTALQSTFTTVLTLSVSGAGSDDSPFLIEFQDPGGLDEPQIEVNGNLLTSTGTITGSKITIDTKQHGGTPGIGNWTKSTDLRNSQLHGSYASDGFRVDDQVSRSGDFSLRINGLTQFAGLQQVVQVIPGMRYRASIWVWTNSAVDLFRLVIRDRFEGLVEWSKPIEQLATPGDWTKFELSFVAPTHTSLLVFRFAYVGTGNPEPYWVDDAELAPGAAPSTIGTIWLEQLDDIQINHAVGEGRSFLTWVTPTFDEINDSAGVPWPGVHSLTINEGNTLLQLMEHHHSEYGYEFDLRYDQDDDTFYFDVFNPGALGVDHPDNFPAIVVGPGVTDGELTVASPTGTILFARGSGGIWRESTTFAGIVPWGRRERYISLPDAHADFDLQQAVSAEQEQVLADMIGMQYRMTDAGQSVPMLHFRAGDYVTTTPGEDTGISSGSRRISSIKVDGHGGNVTGVDVHVGSEVFGSLGLAAQAEAVRRLIRKIRFVQPDTGGGLPFLAGGGGIPDVVVSANDTKFTDSANLFARDYFSDDEMYLAAIQSIKSTGGGWIHFLEGNYTFQGGITAALLVGISNLKVTGAGRQATTITAASGSSMAMMFSTDIGAGNFTFEDLTISGNKSVANVTDAIISEASTSGGRRFFNRVRITSGDGVGIDYFANTGVFYLTDTEIDSNVSWGFRATDGTVVAKGCDIRHNNTGVVTGGGAHAQLWMGCSIHENNGSGFADSGLFGAQTMVIIGCLIEDNANDGVDLDGSAGKPCLVVGNVIRNNGGAAVSAHVGSVVEHNLRSGNGGGGTQESVHVTDHGDLTGLGDPADHTWALLVDGSRAADLLNVTTALVAQTVRASGLGDATAVGRWAGVRATGAPTTGTFALGDWVTTQDGNLWICTAAGTPGTWTAVGAAAATDADAIHVNVDGEIDGIADVGTLAPDDVFVVEKASGAFSKAKVSAAQLGAGFQELTFSQVGPLAVGTGTFRFYAHRPGTIQSISAAVGVVPTGSSVIVDVNKNGTTLFTTQANRPTIAASANHSGETTPDVTAIAEGDFLTVDIDQIGSTNMGEDLTVMVAIGWSAI